MSQSVTMPYGPVMPVGKMVENPFLKKTKKKNKKKKKKYSDDDEDEDDDDDDDSYLPNDRPEIVVYDPKQVRIRYIVQLEKENLEAD